MVDDGKLTRVLLSLCYIYVPLWYIFTWLAWDNRKNNLRGHPNGGRRCVITGQQGVLK